MPSPWKRQANRFGGVGFAAPESAAKSRTDSNQGNAMVHPRPWSITRREIRLGLLTVSLRLVQ
jgi:hypothetical protein